MPSPSSSRHPPISPEPNDFIEGIKEGLDDFIAGRYSSIDELIKPTQKTQIQEAEHQVDFWKTKFDSTRLTINDLIKDEKIAGEQLKKWQDRLNELKGGQ